MGRFEEVFDQTDFAMTTSATDVSLTADKWILVGQKTVGAQTAHQFGVGVIKDGVDSRETSTIRLDSNGGVITDGKLRLRMSDANENREETVIEGLLAEWTAGKKVGLSELAGGEDDILKIEVRANTLTVVDMSDTDNSVAIPVTTTTRR